VVFGEHPHEGIGRPPRITFPKREDEVLREFDASKRQGVFLGERRDFLAKGL